MVPKVTTLIQNSKSCQKVVRNHSFLHDNHFSQNHHDKMTTYDCGKNEIRLSEGRQKVVREDLLDHFSLMVNFLPESCQDKLLPRGFQDT